MGKIRSAFIVKFLVKYILELHFVVILRKYLK